MKSGSDLRNRLIGPWALKEYFETDVTTGERYYPLSRPDVQRYAQDGRLVLDPRYAEFLKLSPCAVSDEMSDERQTIRHVSADAHGRSERAQPVEFPRSKPGCSAW